MKSLMNKLAMVAVAALVIVGYMIVQRQGAVQDVKIQGWQKSFKKAGGDINKAFGNGGKVDLGLPCEHDSHCKSNFCKQGTCHSTTAGCYYDSDCQSGYKCSQPNDKTAPGYCKAPN